MTLPGPRSLLDDAQCAELTRSNCRSATCQPPVYGLKFQYDSLQTNCLRRPRSVELFNYLRALKSIICYGTISQQGGGQRRHGRKASSARSAFCETVKRSLAFLSSTRIFHHVDDAGELVVEDHTKITKRMKTKITPLRTPPLLRRPLAFGEFADLFLCLIGCHDFTRALLVSQAGMALF